MLTLENLNTKIIGRNILYYEEIDSTQKRAKELIGEAKEGSIIFAEKQTAGIGTHGRPWHTSPQNLAFTIILYPNCEIEKLENVTYKIAECMVQAVKELYAISLEIKLPNDIMYEKKKIAGILTQTNVTGNMVSSMLIGLGMNINQEEFPEEINQIATSLKKEFGIETNREEILEKFLEKLEKIYEEIKGQGY